MVRIFALILMIASFAFCNHYAIAAVSISESKQTQDENKDVSLEKLKLIKSELIVYSKVLTKYNEAVENLQNLEFYKSWSASDKENNRTITVKDLSELQQLGFFMLRGEELHKLFLSQVVFMADIKDFLDKIRVPVGENREEYMKTILEIKKEVNNFTKKLKKIHVDLASKRESMVEKAVQKHSDNEQLITELKKYKELLRKEHDRLNLIDRQQQR